jgi:hypothetical protein
MMRPGFDAALTRDRNAKTTPFCFKRGGNKPNMITFLEILVVLAMAGVFGVLVAGMVGLVRGNNDPARSNRLMRWRIILQGAALLLFALLMTLLRP